MYIAAPKDIVLNYSKKWLLEFLFILATAVVCILVILPIHLSGVAFEEFMYYNILFVAIGLSWLRLIIRLDLHPLAHSRIFKLILIIAAPMLFFPTLEGLHSFIEFNDREGIQSLLEHLEISNQNQLINYIRIEYLLFGLMSFLGSFLIILKMIRSLWRQYKYGII